MDINNLLKQLNISNPWIGRPSVPVDTDERCFNNQRQLLKLLKNDFLVLEIGAWLGASTRFFARNAKFVITIDHWLGNIDHIINNSPKLPTLYETFITNCWDLRDKILPIKTNSKEGIQLILDSGIKPDLVYLDGDHRYDGLMSDLLMVSQFTNNPIITGDDFYIAKNHEVPTAIDDFIKKSNFDILVDGKFWRLIKK